MTEAATTARSDNRTVTGVVASDKGHKTIKVIVNYQMRHPKYGKYLKRRTVLHAHDETNQAKEGDTVELAECRPLSKTKHHRLLRIVQKAAERAVQVSAEEIMTGKAPTEREKIAETQMIQQQSYLDIADNTGAKLAMCIKVLRGSSSKGKFKRKVAHVGDVIICAVKKTLAGGEIKQGEIIRCVIVRTKHPTRRVDGSYVRFDRNAAVVIDKDNNPRGTRIFGAVARELRDKNFMKIVSLASEVV